MPGFLVWPNKIHSHRETWVPAVTHDFLPTILDVLHVQSDHPSYELDGISLMPFITGEVMPSVRPKPIGFWWGSTQAWIDNDFKIVNSLSPGQGCVAEAPYVHFNSSAAFRMYNLTADYSESVVLNDLPQHAERFSSMQKDLANWISSVERSMAIESHCDSETPPAPAPPTPAPPGPTPTNCTFQEGIGGFGGDQYKKQVESLTECCKTCIADTDCTVAVFDGNMKTCHIKAESKPGYAKKGFWACRARPK